MGLDDGGILLEIVCGYFGALCKWIYYNIRAGIICAAAPTLEEIIAKKKRRKGDQYIHAATSNTAVGSLRLWCL